ncbi:interleukin-18 isoform X1 [Falco cherrug]|uniref:interleukin-18 isoform X1 n=1 Tax=Falco cherrug TaxID=345164 RepID=UPI00247AF6A8|nr:interleukin-18 isoform X1 [Falco cherrug]XP_055675500.1 interleukin-18 isoform X1 [Falco peregrinus]
MQAAIKPPPRLRARPWAGTEGGGRGREPGAPRPGGSRTAPPARYAGPGPPPGLGGPWGGGRAWAAALPSGIVRRGARVKMSGEEILMCAVQLGKNFCLYFADDDGLECDAFCKERILHRVLRNVNSQLLVVRPDLNMAAFEDVTDQEMKSGHGMHFNIHCYKTTTPSAGLPVAFSIKIEDKNYYMCCEKEHGEMIVRFKEGEVPKEIPGESNVIFFKKTFTSCSARAFKFEYSLERGMFLAFEEEGCLRKLILKKLSREDEVDETMKISF